MNANVDEKEGVVVTKTICTELCGCWAFNCNNKTSQPGINEECEDV